MKAKTDRFRIEIIADCTYNADKDINLIEDAIAHTTKGHLRALGRCMGVISIKVSKHEEEKPLADKD